MLIIRYVNLFVEFAAKLRYYSEFGTTFKLKNVLGR